MRDPVTHTKKLARNAQHEYTQCFDPNWAKKAPKSPHGKRGVPRLAWSEQGRAWAFGGDCLAFMHALSKHHPEGIFDSIFADPPYLLSNGGITCNSGRMVSVDKGAWDRSRGPDADHDFNYAWLGLCKSLLKPNGTIWVSGTSHSIFSVGFSMQQLEFKILNDIAWVKANPPPNLSCRYFTHSTETVLWAAKSKKSKHVFNYEVMKRMNEGRQMQNVWRLPAPAAIEKTYGKHATQKPLSLLARILLSSTLPGDLVLDPFMGSGTTGVAAILHGRHFVGIDLDRDYLCLAIKRLKDAIQESSQNLFPNSV